MNMDELEEALGEILPTSKFRIDVKRNNEIVIYTNLQQEDDGELTDMSEDDFDEEDMDFEPSDSEVPDFEDLADEEEEELEENDEEQNE